MMSRFFLIMILAAAASGAPYAGPPDDVDAYVRGKFHLTNYRWAEADLNGDGAPEQFIYATDEVWCGSGGCTLLVLQKQGKTYHLVLRSTVTRLPVRLLATKSHGWRDIAVNVAGGGTTPRTVRLRFNGFNYPSNPTFAPSLSEERAKTASILIP